MKKTTILLLLLSSFFLQAQMQYEGSNRYGRLSNFAYDHKVEGKIYASIHNKLFESTDNGDSWSVIYSSLAGSKIIKLRVLNENELVFLEFFGTSLLNCISVLNLQDNSIKRIEMPSVHGSAEIDCFDVFSDDSDIVFLNLFKGFTKGYGMYTNNAGQTWKTVYTAEEYVDKIPIVGLSISQNNPDKLVIVRGIGNTVNDFEGGGVWVSEDGGDTWGNKYLENIILKVVAFNPLNDEEIIAGTGLRWNVPHQEQAVYRTTDNGATWSTIDTEWDEGGGALKYITGINFNPHTSGNIVILGDNEIVSTTDNGVTWTNTTYLGIGNVQGYFHASSVTFDPFVEGKLLINNSYYPLQSDDGGITTERFVNSFYAVGGDVSIYGDANEIHLYHAVQYGYVNTDYITKDEKDIDVVPLNVSFLTGYPSIRLQVDKSTPGRVFTYYSGTEANGSPVYRLELSEDYGETKTILYSNKMYSYANMRIDPYNDVVWLSVVDRQYRSNLVKVDFTDIDNIDVNNVPIPKSSKRLFSIELDPNNSSNIIIALDNELYLSRDAGSTWDEITNELSSVLTSQDYVLSIKSNPLRAGQYTLATNKGVFTTLNSGNSWVRLNEDNVLYVEHSTAVNGHLIGIAYTSQVLNFDIIYSTDNGKTWKKIENKELNYAQTNNSADALFSEDAMQIFTGTHSLGTISYKIELEDITNNSSVTLSVVDGIKPIEGANVNFGGGEYITDADGTVSITHVMDGTYDYTVTMAGYEDVFGEIFVDGEDISKTIELTSITGINTDLLSNLTVYPNPFSSEINITNADNINRVVITNLIGQRVMDVVLNDTETINTSELSNGVYIVTLEDYSGERTIRKMIKK